MVLAVLVAAGAAAWFFFFRKKAAGVAPATDVKNVVEAMPRVVSKNGTNTSPGLDINALVGLGSKLTGIKIPSPVSMPPLSLPPINSAFGTPTTIVKSILKGKLF